MSCQKRNPPASATVERSRFGSACYDGVAICDQLPLFNFGAAEDGRVMAGPRHERGTRAARIDRGSGAKARKLAHFRGPGVSHAAMAVSGMLHSAYCCVWNS